MSGSPVVRTNPVTGWKSLFGAAHQVKAGWFNGVTERESEILKTYCTCKGTWRKVEVRLTMVVKQSTSSLPRITTSKFDSVGAKTTWLFGTTAPSSIPQPSR